MQYVNTTEPEFETLAARVGEGPCLYSIISGWDWHLRLCFVRIYPNGSNRSGRIITSGELEIVTDAAEWFLFDLRRFPNRRHLVASNVEYGYGDKDHDYFSEHVWQIDLSRLPQLVLKSDGLLLEAHPNEYASETHACWCIYHEEAEQPKQTLFYEVYEKSVRRANGSDPS